MKKMSLRSELQILMETGTEQLQLYGAQHLVSSMTMNSNSAVDVGYMSPKEVEHAITELRNELNLKHNQAQRKTIQEAKIDEKFGSTDLHWIGR